MDAATNELTRPLGQERTRTAGPSWLPPVLRGTLMTASAVVVAAFAGSALYGDPRGGRPIARADIVVRAPEPEPRPAATEPRTASAEPNRQDAGTVEITSGVTVVRPAGTSAPTSIVVRVPDAAAPVAAADPRLVESSRHGPLPRIGPDGAQPLDVYAGRSGELPGGARPSGRIAIVVGGLGISRSATDDAIAGLPAPVTLAFAPYGPDLERQSAAARARGHETMLQIPMEPFDYPDSDPGPHTLIAGAKPNENLDHLHWAMGRFTGYAAVMNYMGAKLTSTERALAPLLKEVGSRGLGFLDDGSSSRSLVTSLAGETRATRADAVLDGVPRADLVDKALAALEKQALSSGRIAVATASALPVTLERIGRWAAGLEARGIILVPVSAALAARAQSARR